MASRVVLVVEDNDYSRDICATYLRYVGYTVVEAASGPEGIERARSASPDLILMDVALPGIDGWKATQILKADPETRHIPIVAVTARALPTDRERAIEVGCDHYLAKPVEPRTIAAVVAKFLPT